MTMKKKAGRVSFVTRSSSGPELDRLANIPFTGTVDKVVEVWLQKIGEAANVEHKGRITTASPANINLVTVSDLTDGDYYIKKIKVGDYAVEYSQPEDLTKIRTVSSDNPQVRFGDISFVEFLRNEPKEITITGIPTVAGLVVVVDGRELPDAEKVNSAAGLKIRLAPGDRSLILRSGTTEKRKSITVTEPATITYASFAAAEAEVVEEEEVNDPVGGRIRVCNVPEGGSVFARKGDLNVEISIEDGDGTSSKIKPGRWEVRVEIDGMRQNNLDRSVTVVAGEDLEIDFGSTPDASVRLKITNVVAGSTITGRGPGSVTREFTVTEGTTNITDISPGQWTIVITNGNSRIEKQVTISSTQTVEISATPEVGSGSDNEVSVKKDDLMKYGIGGAALLLLGYLALSGDEKKSKKKKDQDDE